MTTTFQVRPDLNIRTWGSYEKMRSLGDIVTTLTTSGGIEYDLEYMIGVWDEFENECENFISHLMQIAEEHKIKEVGAWKDVKYNIDFRRNEYTMELSGEEINIRNMAIGTLSQVLVQNAVRKMLEKREG